MESKLQKFQVKAMTGPESASCMSPQLHSVCPWSWQDKYLVLEEGLFKSFPEGSCHRLIAIRFHVVGGVYVEGAVPPHNQPGGQAAVHPGQVLQDKGMLF